MALGKQKLLSGFLDDWAALFTLNLGEVASQLDSAIQQDPLLSWAALWALQLPLVWPAVECIPWPKWPKCTALWVQQLVRVSGGTLRLNALGWIDPLLCSVEMYAWVFPPSLDGAGMGALIKLQSLTKLVPVFGWDLLHPPWVKSQGRAYGGPGGWLSSDSSQIAISISSRSSQLGFQGERCCDLVPMIEHHANRYTELSPKSAYCHSLLCFYLIPGGHAISSYVPHPLWGENRVDSWEASQNATEARCLPPWISFPAVKTVGSGEPSLWHCATWEWGRGTVKQTTISLVLSMRIFIQFHGTCRWLVLTPTVWGFHRCFCLWLVASWSSVESVKPGTSSSTMLLASSLL